MNWHDIFVFVLFLVGSVLGVPIIQAIKNWLKLEDKWAMLVALVISFLLALAEMLLGKALNLADLTMENLPALFAAVYAVASVYYQLLKGSESVFGQKFMIRKAG